jgi:glutamyl/glutaminyl-tRNA synthetase
MEILRFFFECPFNQDEKFHDLDKIIQNYKKKENSEYILQLIADLHKIIQTQNYPLASHIMQKYGNRKLNDLKETEKFIHFLYDRFTDRPTNLEAEYFTSVENEPATMFKDKNTANKAVKENLNHNAEEIAHWLTNNSPVFKKFEFKHSQPIGCGFLKSEDLSPYSLEESGISYDLAGSRIVLEIDSNQDLGFRIVTAFPIMK